MIDECITKLDELTLKCTCMQSTLSLIVISTMPEFKGVDVKPDLLAEATTLVQFDLEDLSNQLANICKQLNSMSRN